MPAAPLALALVLATVGGPAIAEDARGTSDLPLEPASAGSVAGGTGEAELGGPATPAEPTRILGAVISIDGVDASATREAIALRLPELPIYDRRSGAPSSDPDDLYAYLELRRRDPATVALRVILSDGRAFRREVSVEDVDAPRVIAGTLASLVPAIEEATIVADEEDVELPPALLPAQPHHEELSEPEPEPPEPEPPEPEPEPPEPDPDPERSTAPIDVGLTLGTGGLFGSAAPSLGWRSPTGHLGVDLRLRRGVLAGLDLRIAGGRSADLRLLRLRSALTLGYVLRRRAFELPIAGLLSLEPWWLRGAGGEVLRRGDDGSPPRPLIGLGLRLSPGLYVALPKQLHLRIGARLEASLSGEASRGLPRPVISSEALVGSALTLGGLELSAGVELTLWLPSARADRRARGSTP